MENQLSYLLLRILDYNSNKSNYERYFSNQAECVIEKMRTISAFLVIKLKRYVQLLNKLQRKVCPFFSESFVFKRCSFFGFYSYFIHLILLGKITVRKNNAFEKSFRSKSWALR